MLLVITVGLFGPLEMYLSNRDDIWFSFSDVIKITVMMSGAMILFLGILGWLLRGKARAWLGACAFLLGVGLFIQGTFLNINLGALDGKSIDWNKYTTQGIINTAIWLVLLAAGIILFIRKDKLFSFIQKIGSGMVLFIETATIVMLLLTSGNLDQANSSSSYLTTEGIYSVGQEENIVIFVLDCFDEAFFQKALEESPEYNDIFRDFTHYDNAAVAAATTKAGLPAIITGKAYSGGISYQDYIQQAFDSDGLYTALHKKGYNTRIYTDSSFVANGVTDRVTNQSETGYTVSNYIGLTLKYEKMTLFKYLPHVFKPLAWMYTGDLDEYKSGVEGEAYIFDDIQFYQRLMENGLQVVPGKSFQLYHLKAVHSPYVYDRNVVKSEESNVMEQARGALRIVADYVDQLKECETYDKATIIIMADHGETHEQFPQKNKAHGILLVKEANQNANTMRTVSSSVSYWDLHDELFSVINKSEDKKGFSELYDSAERNRMYYVYDTEHGTLIWKEYIIQGNLNNNGIVKETGNVYKQDFQIEEYKYGQDLTFGDNATAAAYIVSGMSATDTGSHSWTNDKKAIFVIPLESRPKANLLVTMKCAGVYSEAGPQVLYLYANQQLCSKKIMTKGGTYQFVIPGETVGEDKTLELQFVLPYAASPQKLYGAGNRADTRTLAVALYGLMIEETEQEASEMLIPILSAEEYQFTEGENEANAFFLRGLSKPEKGHTWTNDHYVIMEFRLDEATSNDLGIAFLFSRVYNNQQHCRIRSGDTILFEKTLSEDDKEISFTFPQSCMINGNEVHVIMELPDACSPNSLGRGKDIRELALALTQMTIREKSD